MNWGRLLFLVVVLVLIVVGGWYLWTHIAQIGATVSNQANRAGAETSTPTQTVGPGVPAPTYTPLPTYTPAPTYTPYPTPAVVLAALPTIPVTVTPVVVGTGTVLATGTICPDKAVRIEPQGVLQPDGSFIAQTGKAGCVTVFEGRIWEAGKPIQPRHDIVMINGAKDGFRYWEGNGWLIPSSWSSEEFACQIWVGKQNNWKSQGITPLPVKFWGFSSTPVCAPVVVATASVAVAITPSVSTSAPVPAAPTPATTPVVSVSTFDSWAKLLNIPVTRLEACLGEDVASCVHVKDGLPFLDVVVPAGFKFVGWDGSQNISGVGLSTAKHVSGLTVRPS